MPTTVKETTMLATTSKPCAFGEFKCKINGECIYNTYLCDADNDCLDGEDESKAVCEGKTCSPQQFACKNGKCIPKHLKCDSINQCGDNSDEEDCRKYLHDFEKFLFIKNTCLYSILKANDLSYRASPFF